MLYAAKCYWPGVSRADLEKVARNFARTPRESSEHALAYRGTLLFSEDELVLCLFDAPSRMAVKHMSERIGIPCERVMESVWLDPHESEGDLR